MTTPHVPPSPADRPRPLAVRRASIQVFVAALMFGWVAFRIWSAFDDLWHYGVDRTVAGTVVIWLSAVTALLYLLAGILLLTGAGLARRLVIALAVPGALCGIYLIVVGATHTDFVGFPAGPLMFVGVAAVVFAGATGRAVARDPDIAVWLERRRPHPERA